jgi:crotonobetainyl-CoA:carnitine CoA-transferase CaiB-like acyl-CoA transferase
MPESALDGLSVVECAQGVAGPFCGKALADLGADVIKVEPPAGDRSRGVGPFPEDVPHPECSGQFLYLNANKRGITLDLEDVGGRQTLRDLARAVDILIIDLSPRQLQEWELDYARLQPLNPQLIMTCLSPFGQTGPYRDYKSTELTSFHVGGMGRETPHNEVTDPERQPPLKAGGDQAGYLTGWTAATATMVAVHHRAAYGTGQMVDVAAMDAVASMLRFTFAALSHDPTSTPSTRLKAGAPWILPCKNGHVSFSPFHFDHWWAAFKEMMGHPDWASSEVFATLQSRLLNADVIEAKTLEWLMQHTKEEIYEMVLGRGLPGFPVNSIAEVVNSRQFVARHFFVEVEHPLAGIIKQPGPAARYRGTPFRIARPAPRLGEPDHSRLSAELGRNLGTAPGPPPPAAVHGTAPGTGELKNRPLAGIRIAEFGWVMAVPHATAWLGSLGAEVIRIESNTRLDMVRISPLAPADGVPGVNRSSFFNGLNFSKKSITLNLALPEGVRLAKELVKRSDVVTENFSAGVIDRLGLGYGVLKRIKPDIIMLSATPLGSDGPERLATGWGPNTQAYAGLPHITGYEGGPPSGLGGNWPDYMIGTTMAFALLAALHHRARSGQGQLIEVAMAETVATMIPEAILDYTMNGRERPRMGNRHESMAPHGVYPCKGDDKWAAIAVATDREWQALRQVMGNPTWAEDPRFEHAAGRHAHQDLLDGGIAAWTKQHTHYDVMHCLQAVGIAAAPCLDVRELTSDPQLQEREFLVELDHNEVGRRTVAGLPGKFSAMPQFAFGPAPLLGEHNEAVFCGILGLSPAEFARRVDEKVIY